MADMFVFLRIPLILSKMLSLNVSKAEIYDALIKISNCSTLLNEVDLKKFHNTFQHISQELKQLNVINNDELNLLNANRYFCFFTKVIIFFIRKLGIERKSALVELLCKNTDDSSNRSSFQKSRVHLIVAAQKAKKAFERVYFY